MNRALSYVSIVTVQAMTTVIHPRTSTLSNGLQLITERNEAQKSASFCWLIPGGVAHDPLGHGDGWASMISEYLLRGAGDLTSREFSEALDRIGARRSVVADSYFIRTSVTVCGENIAPAISLFVSMVLRAHFAPEVIDPVRSLSMQELNGLDDDPSQQSHIRLDAIRLPKPFDRHGLGNADHIMATSSNDLKEHFMKIARPGGSIFTAAGDVHHDEIMEQLEKELSHWTGTTDLPVADGDPVGGTTHLERSTSQSHLVMGFDAPLASDAHAMGFQIAAGILGGGASSRLFTEVRERKGLAYSIGGRFEPGKSIGNYTVSAGTTPERIVETLDCIDSVLSTFNDDISDEEIQRVRIQLRSGILMQLEHGPARARRLAFDHFRRGEAKSMDSLLQDFLDTSNDEVRSIASAHMGPEWRSKLTRSIVGPAI